MNIRELAEQAKSQLSDLTGLKPLTITGVFKDEQGWHITLDILEMSRIPSSTDLLGDYETILDDSGNLLSFERKRTRLRGERAERGDGR